MTDVALESLVRDYQIFRAMITRLSTRNDPLFLAELVNAPRFTAELRTDPEAFDRWAAPLTARLALMTGPAVDYAIRHRAADDDQAGGIELTKLVHGIPETRHISFDFFDSADYGRIAALAEKLDGLLEAGAQVGRGERGQEVERFDQAYDWLMSEAKRGYHIQRYKGLGEMNPDQLWDTTMDPTTRRLLRVTIEDAVAADQIFTTLMGEHVEPRRAFIERNALEAGNIDI